MAAFLATLAASVTAPDGSPLPPGEAKRAENRGANGDALLFLSRGGDITRQSDKESDVYRAHYRAQHDQRKSHSPTNRHLQPV